MPEASNRSEVGVSRSIRSKSAREAALALVARRLLSVSELTQRLAKKGYPAAKIEDAVALVCSYGYVNDEALATAVRHEAERRGRGPCWVRATLLRRGIRQELADHVQELAQGQAAQRAQGLLTCRFGEITAMQGHTRRRAYRFLLGRGFSADIASDLLDEAG